MIHSEPLPDAVARRIRETRSILIFSNLREYGDFIITFRDGTVESFGGFITRDPGNELREEAQHIYDGLVYRPFKIRGTHQALDEFIKKYPDNFYVSREDETIVKVIQESGKGDHILVYNVVFDTLGEAPWSDVDDIEKY